MRALQCGTPADLQYRDVERDIPTKPLITLSPPYWFSHSKLVPFVVGCESAIYSAKTIKLPLRIDAIPKKPLIVAKVCRSPNRGYLSQQCLFLLLFGIPYPAIDIVAGDRCVCLEKWPESCDIDSQVAIANAHSGLIMTLVQQLRPDLP